MNGGSTDCPTRNKPAMTMMTAGSLPIASPVTDSARGFHTVPPEGGSVGQADRRVGSRAGAVVREVVALSVSRVSPFVPV